MSEDLGEEQLSRLQSTMALQTTTDYYGLVSFVSAWAYVSEAYDPYKQSVIVLQISVSFAH